MRTKPRISKTCIKTYDLCQSFVHCNQNKFFTGIVQA